MYSDLIIEHFTNPRNLGRIEDADGVGISGDPNCGDHVKLYIKVTGECLADTKFEVHGCPAAIATTSIFSEMIMGKPLTEALVITEEDVANALGGLSEEKMHCSNLAKGALIQAVWGYFISSKADRAVVNKVISNINKGKSNQ